jgi:hypothetical protein
LVAAPGEVDVDGSIAIISCIAFFLVIAIALPVALSMRRNRVTRERWAALLGWAHGQGWSVTQYPHVEWTARLPGQNAGGISVLVSGAVDGLPAGLAQYSYTTSSTVMVNNTMMPSSETHEYVVCVVWVPPELRHLSIAVENRTGMSKLSRRIFGDSPTATGNEAFDHRFKVWAYPPELAQRLIGPALAAEHLAGRLPVWNLYNGTLVTCHPGRLPDPHMFGALIEPLMRVIALLGR